MKIEFNECTQVELDSLQAGDVFIYEKKVFMKIPTCTYKNEYVILEGNVYSLEDNTIEYLPPCVLVEPKNARMVVS